MYVCTYVFMYMYRGVQIQRLMHVCIFVGENFVFAKGKCATICVTTIDNALPYLSVLKLGSYTHRGSNMQQIAQQDEWNKCLGLFRCWVLKLLSSISNKQCHTLRKISVFLISPLICASSFWMLLQSIIYNIFIMFVVFPQDALTHFVSEWSPWTVINMLASNHAIKLVVASRNFIICIPMWSYVHSNHVIYVCNNGFLVWSPQPHIDHGTLQLKYV